MTRSGDTTLSEPVGLSLPFSAESARVARQHLLQWLNGLGDEERRDDARLVVSELVGNAIRHARPLEDGTMQVAWARCEQDQLDISVTDGGALTQPERVEAAAFDLAGRGLAIVESVASRWWVESDLSRTTVHAVLAFS